MSKPKFRCSGLYHLMTDPKLKADKEAGNLSEGAKTHVLDTWVSHEYKRNEQAYSKYIEKGNETEEDSITLISLHTNTFLLKNVETFENEWICGTPDLFQMKDNAAIAIRDAKSSFDVFTFQRNRIKGLPDAYYWQMQGYLWLCGLDVAYVDFCLNNATPGIISDEIRKLRWQMREPDEDSPEFIERASMIERLHIYDMAAFRKRYANFDLYSSLVNWEYDIPAEKRILTFEVKADPEAHDRIKQKVEKAWELMDVF